MVDCFKGVSTNAATLTVVTLFLRYVGDLNDEKYLQEIFLLVMLERIRCANKIVRLEL